HDRRPANDARNREAAAETLGHGDQVRLDAGMLDREHPAAAAEAGLYLVGDQQDAVLVAGFAQAAQEVRRRRVEAALPLDRLDDDRGDPAGLDVVREQRLE